MVVNPAASNRVWLLFFLLCNGSKKGKKPSCTISLMRKRTAWIFQRLALTFSFFPSFPARFIFDLQTDEVSWAHGSPLMRCGYLSVVLRRSALGQETAVGPALHSLFCLSASSEEGISHPCARNTSAFSQGVLPWITRPAPPCPRAAAEGHGRASEHGTALLPAWEPHFPLLRYSCLSRGT